MKSKQTSGMREVPLPFSDGLLSAKLWQSQTKDGKERFVAYVPELGLSCFGTSDSEASFRLFSALIKYFRQLKAHKEKLGEKGLAHLQMLTVWMNAIEERMTAKQDHPYEGRLIALRGRSR
ncbi:MAG TPA: hypothetical protein PLF23_20775 [Candidatus Obscuribacter sp.]|nr:hypothetical protein [Candidatus Obscuribacter sp.]